MNAALYTVTSLAAFGDDQVTVLAGSSSAAHSSSDWRPRRCQPLLQMVAVELFYDSPEGWPPLAGAR